MTTGGYRVVNASAMIWPVASTTSSSSSISDQSAACHRLPRCTVACISRRAADGRWYTDQSLTALRGLCCSPPVMTRDSGRLALVQVWRKLSVRGDDASESRAWSTSRRDLWVDCCCRRRRLCWFTAKWPLLFVVSVGLSVCLFICLCRVFLSRLWSDFDQTWTYVICLGLVVSPRI